MDTALSMLLVLLKATCVLLVALLVTVALARASAGSRHLVWLTALAGLLVLPGLALWSPIPFRILPAASHPAITQVPGAPVVTPGTVELPALPDVAADPIRGNAATAPAGWSPWTIALAVWGGMAALLLAWLGVGALQVRRIVRRARPLSDASWQEPLYEIADRMGLERAPALLRSDDVMMPFAAGLVRPVIVLPEASDDWSAERRSAVLIHELGHVKRRDLVGHAVSRLACALYWFHPLVWTGARRLRAESERACDDLALEYGTRPSEYAEHLLDIVTCVRDHRTPAVALAMAHRKEFEGRMLAILNPDLARKGLGRGRSLLLAGGIAALAVVVSAARPVAREGGAAGVTAAGKAAGTAAGTAAARSAAPSAAVSPSAARSAAPPAAVASSAAAPAARSAAVPAAVSVPPDSSDDERAAVLARTLRTEEDAELRRIAAWGLEKYARSAVAADALVAALSGDKDGSVREMSAWALADSDGPPAVVAALQKAAAQEQDQKLRRTAIWSLGSIGNEATAEALTTLLADKDAEVRALAAWGIGSASPSRAPAALTALLNDPSPNVRVAAVYALFQIEDPATAAPLASAFEREKDPDLRLKIIRAIGATSGDAAVPVLQKLVTSEDTEVRKEAIKALAGAGSGGVWVWPRPQPRPFP